MSSRTAEKEPLLPIAEAGESRPEESHTARIGIAESVLLLISLLVALFQLSTLYWFDYTLASTSSCPFRRAVASHIHLIETGLPSSIAASLPTAVIFLIAAPYLATREKVGLASCLTVFCYLVGSTWGAFMFGRDLQIAGAR